MSKNNEDELIIRNLNKSYGENQVLKNINLKIKKGEFVSLLGPSGCGKSTLLKIIAGLESAQSGQMLYKGEDFMNIPVQKRNLGMVFQNYALFPNMTVLENVEYGLKAQKKIGKNLVEEKAMYWIKKVQLLGKENFYPSQLSGGQQQRVAIARALATEPQILLLDEPLSALDAIVRASLRSEIRQLQLELGITTIYVTHDQSEALAMSDRVAIMYQGQLLEIDTPEKIYRKPENLFTSQFIGTTNTLPVVMVYGDDYEFSNNSEGELLLKTPEMKKNGSKFAQLCIKSEDIKLADKKQDNYLKAKISLISFQGDTIQYKLMLSNKTELIATEDVNKESEFSIGDEVWVHFKKSKTHFFNEIEEEK